MIGANVAVGAGFERLFEGVTLAESNAGTEGSSNRDLKVSR